MRCGGICWLESGDVEGEVPAWWVLEGSLAVVLLSGTEPSGNLSSCC